MNLFPRRSHFLLAPLNYLMNLFPRRSYFRLASLNYLMNLFPRRSYFLLASLNYLTNLFPRRSYFLLASQKYLMGLFPTRTYFRLASLNYKLWDLTLILFSNMLLCCPPRWPIAIYLSTLKSGAAGVTGIVEKMPTGFYFAITGICWVDNVGPGH